MAELGGVFRMEFVYPMQKNPIDITKENSLRKNNL